MPISIECGGYGQPFYTNFVYPFKCDPPKIAADINYVVLELSCKACVFTLLFSVVLQDLTLFTVVIWISETRCYILQGCVSAVPEGFMYNKSYTGF